MFDFSNLPALAQSGPPAEEYGIHVVVETPQGSRNKINFNEKFGLFQFSRTLRAGLIWPCDFGFVPHTLAGDGDPLDVAFLNDAPLPCGVFARARVVGAIGLSKNGEENDRIIAVPARSEKAPSRWDGIRDLSDFLPREIRELEAFLSDYNTFEGHRIELTGWKNAARAWELVLAAVEKGKSA